MIYILEDDNSIRELVAYTLHSAGFEAEGFERPSAFWRACAERRPDLVLLDLMLPEEDGISILKKLRQAPETARLPILLLTAKSSEYDKVLGLDSGEKSLLLTMMPKTDADDLLIRLRRELRLGLSGSGIAFTVPISGANKRVLQMVQQVCQEKPKPEMRRALMQENDYQIIVALVNQGYSEEVMAAARPAGAAGGTVLHSRRVGAEEALSQWGFSLQEEKEAVMILAKAESKLAIMQAICDNCGLQSEAQGIVLSLPVDNVVGLE